MAEERSEQDPNFHERHVSHENSEEHEQNRTVLIAVDASDISALAFESYVEHLHRPENRVVVFNVIEPPNIRSAGFGGSTSWGPMVTDTAAAYTLECDKTIQAAKRLQQQYVHDMKEAGIHGKVVICYNDKTGHAITEYARKEAIDFIVVGSRGLGKLRRTFMGSHSSYVVNHVTVPVFVVPPKEGHGHGTNGDHQH